MTGHRQLRYVSNIGVGETPAHSQHGTDPLQECIAALDRQGTSRVHDDCKLGVGQRNHAPDNNPEKAKLGQRLS
jgi:hypothetical protein